MSGRNFAEWLAAQRERPGERQARRPSRVPGVLSAGDLSVVFQPLVELGRRRIFAYEALVRSNAPEYRSPPALFTAAIEADCCGALGRLIRELAIEHCPSFPLFLNVHPNEFDEGWLVQPDDPIFRHEHPIYLEITESVPLSHFHYCHSVLNEIRGKGIMVAVDDLGAGYSNLKYIADLAPEVVKLDRGLVTELWRDKRRQRLVTSIVRLCVELGARVVAEGLEDADEVQAALDSGAHFGQGYALARPSFPPPNLDLSAFGRVPINERR